MNARAHGLAHGIACAPFSGSVPRTVHAKRREDTTPHHTTPDLLVAGFQDQKLTQLRRATTRGTAPAGSLIGLEAKS
jgi:hypothetical protein